MTTIIGYVLFLLALITIVIIIINNKRRNERIFTDLNELFNAAADGNAVTLNYDESVYSALSSRLLTAVEASKTRLLEIQHDRNKLSSLISDISHQTRTPAANIKLYSEIMLDRGDLSEADMATVKDLLTQTEKLTFLIDSLVKMSRLETGVLELTVKKTFIKPLIAAAVSDELPGINAKNINLSIDCAESLTAVFDSKWTKEALVNIINNAVKYTPAGGSINITANAFEMFVCINISDSGIGIKADEINEIFKRFYRAKISAESDGIGVGLYLAREIINHEKGYIKAVSKQEQGSTFSVFLPIET